jgi:hypothetical protein
MFAILTRIFCESAQIRARPGHSSIPRIPCRDGRQRSVQMRLRANYLVLQRKLPQSPHILSFQAEKRSRRRHRGESLYSGKII